jgi:mono/diheme cytochrome c family protein
MIETETVRALAAATVVLLLTGGAAAQQGDVQRGRVLAQTWCASCHIVAGDAARAGADKAPPFPVIARDPAKGPDYLRSWLTQAHVGMPDFSLSRREMDDLIAYIGSLAP